MIALKNHLFLIKSINSFRKTRDFMVHSKKAKAKSNNFIIKSHIKSLVKKQHKKSLKKSLLKKSLKKIS